MRWAYSVWFRNLLVETDDQDYEWVAVFVIEADTADAARFWVITWRSLTLAGIPKKLCFCGPT